MIVPSQIDEDEIFSWFFSVLHHSEEIGLGHSYCLGFRSRIRYMPWSFMSYVVLIHAAYFSRERGLTRMVVVRGRKGVVDICEKFKRINRIASSSIEQ
jgi:hypothetical protein